MADSKQKPKTKIVVKRPTKIRTVKREADKKAESGTPAGGSDIPAPPSKKSVHVFKFYCAYCGHEVTTRTDRAGDRVQCSVCDRHVTVPEPNMETLDTSDEQAAAAPVKNQAASPSREFKFYCTYCAQKLSATENMAGKQTICPTCSNRIVIPMPVSKDDQAGSAKKEETFQFFCQFCGTRSLALKSWAGSRICCPGCSSMLTIPQPTAKKS